MRLVSLGVLLLSLSMKAVMAQDCWDITIIAFNTVTDPGGVVNWDSSNVHWTLYDTTTGYGTDLSYGIPYKICGATKYKVTVAEVRAQTEPQTRTAWLLLNDHRIFTFSKPAKNYNSIYFSMENSDIVQFTDWFADDISYTVPPPIALSSCRQMTVSVNNDRYAQVKVFDPTMQLAYYAYGNGAVLSTSSISFLPEICYDGNYTFDIVHQPFDSCHPTSLTWNLTYNYQMVYQNSIWQKEVAEFSWVSGAVNNISSETFGSGTAHVCPTTGAPASSSSAASGEPVTWVWILPLTGVLIGVVVVAWRDKICSYNFRRKYCECKRRRKRRLPSQKADAKDDEESSQSDDDSYQSQKGGAGKPAERGALVKPKTKGKLSDILE